jgi:Na+-transporting methylmalonyl-CoA/oxaloacetate decarboxylase gamma subunit
MKKIGFLMIALLMVTIVSMGQNWQNSTPEEMAKRQTDQIKEKCGLDKDQEKKVYDLSLKSGKEMAKMREEMYREIHDIHVRVKLLEERTKK